MQNKNLTKISYLVLLLGLSNQLYSQSQKSKTMNKSKVETIGLLVIMKAKPNKTGAVKNFLLNGLSLVNAEPKTTSWFAFQLDEQTFGIYDTFEAESGRQAHLTGEVAKALMTNAADLLVDFDPNKDIKKVDLVASNHKIGHQSIGLLVMMRAKDDNIEQLEQFLQTGRNMVGDEPGTLSWYGIKVDTNTYAIFDTFETEDGRNAHLTGKIAASLLENAPIILDGFETSAIQKINILAAK